MIRRRADVLWRRSGDRVVVLPVDQSEPLGLGGLGALLWALASEDGCSLEQLSADVSACTGASTSDAGDRVGDAVDELASHNIFLVTR